MADTFKLSSESEEIADRMSRYLELGRPNVIRLALAKGLEAGVTVEGNSKGAEIPLGVVVKGNEYKLWHALITQRMKRRVAVAEFPGLLKKFVDGGLAVMSQETASLGRPDLDYLVKLASTPTKGRNGATPITSIPEIVVTVGSRVGDGHDIKLAWNLHEHNQHFGVVGTTGAGKTQFVLDLLAQIKAISPNTGMIFIDFAKGDVASNFSFAKLTGAEVLDIRDRPAPVNPLSHPQIENEMQRRYLIEGFVELVSSLDGRIGNVQKNHLVDILHEAYKRSGLDPNFYTIRQVMNEFYEERSMKPDTLSEMVRQLTDLHLFPENGEPVYAPLYPRSVVFDLHRLTALKDLTAFLILQSLYTELSQLPDSQVADGMRQVRTVIVIDEAHRYLRYKNRVLENMLRELRSKGVAVVLLSQGIEDFKQRDFDYSELLHWRFVLKNTCTATDLTSFLGIKPEQARALAPRVAYLPGGDAIFVDDSSGTGQIVEFKTRQFWQRDSQTQSA